MSNTTTQAAVTITGSGKVCAVINGQSYTIASDHPKYKQIIESIKQKNWDLFVDLVNITKQVQNYTGVDVSDGAIMFNGEVIHNTLTKRIVKFMGEGLPFDPLLKFLGNLMKNPSKRAVDELYDFLEAGELPITEDGCFLAFKNVRSDFKDIHSGTFDNSVGKVCEMPRNRVCDNKDQTCSAGLHFCSIAYLPSFSDSNGGKTMILKINPADVVSIPADYNNTKGRCCKYEVVAEYKEDWRSKINRGESGWDNDLYSSDGGDYDWDGDEYDDEDEEEYSFGSDCQGSSCHYGYKPSGHKFHNVRDNTGKFSKKM
jgi:hypothetical protein